MELGAQLTGAAGKLPCYTWHYRANSAFVLVLFVKFWNFIWAHVRPRLGVNWVYILIADWRLISRLNPYQSKSNAQRV